MDESYISFTIKYTVGQRGRPLEGKCQVGKLRKPVQAHCELLRRLKVRARIIFPLFSCG